MSRVLADAERVGADHGLRVRRRVHRPGGLDVRGLRGGLVQGRARTGGVRVMSGAHVLVRGDRARDGLLVRDRVHQGRRRLRADGAAADRAVGVAGRASTESERSADPERDGTAPPEHRRAAQRGGRARAG